MIHAEARIYLTRKHALLPAKSPAVTPVFKSDRLLARELIISPFDYFGFFFLPLVASDGVCEQFEVFLDHIAEYVEIVNPFREYAAKIVQFLAFRKI